MAGQENFKAVIKAHLEQRAKTDKQFAKAYKNKAKSIDECCNYILGEAQKLAKSGQVVLPREEVFGMAIHYYDEADIKDVKKTNCMTIVSPMEEDKPNIMGL